jgi:desulfoferrodoxin-like iron-binding protein
MSIFVCKVCGHIEFGSAPDNCPVCFAPKTSFQQKDNVFTESEEKSKEASPKHIPSIKVVKECGIIPEENCTDVIVRIGEKLHPMEEAHFISFIDCYIDDKYVSRVMLSPGVWASAVFHVKKAGAKVTIVEKCNIHGWWKSEAPL